MAGSRSGARGWPARLQPSYTLGIHDALAARALALELVHKGRSHRGVRRAGRDRDPLAAVLLTGPRAQATARVGRACPGASGRARAAGECDGGGARATQAEHAAGATDP